MTAADSKTHYLSYDPIYRNKILYAIFLRKLPEIFVQKFNKCFVRNITTIIFYRENNLKIVYSRIVSNPVSVSQVDKQRFHFSFLRMMHTAYSQQTLGSSTPINMSNFAPLMIRKLHQKQEDIPLHTPCTGCSPFRIYLNDITRLGQLFHTQH